MKKCKKCLLREAGEAVTYDEIIGYINTLDADTLTDDAAYNYRLSICKECDNLISGTCLKCGCYVEIRARLKASACADYDNERW